MNNNNQKTFFVTLISVLMCNIDIDIENLKFIFKLFKLKRSW